MCCSAQSIIRMRQPVDSGRIVRDEPCLTEPHDGLALIAGAHPMGHRRPVRLDEDVQAAGGGINHFRGHDLQHFGQPVAQRAIGPHAVERHERLQEIGLDVGVLEPDPGLNRVELRAQGTLGAIANERVVALRNPK